MPRFECQCSPCHCQAPQCPVVEPSSCSSLQQSSVKWCRWIAASKDRWRTSTASPANSSSTSTDWLRFVTFSISGIHSQSRPCRSFSILLNNLTARYHNSMRADDPGCSLRSTNRQLLPSGLQLFGTWCQACSNSPQHSLPRMANHRIDHLDVYMSTVSSTGGTASSHGSVEIPMLRVLESGIFLLLALSIASGFRPVPAENPLHPKLPGVDVWLLALQHPPRRCCHTNAIVVAHLRECHCIVFETRSMDPQHI